MLKAVKSDKTITIFEGPDGSGKTTLAKQYAARTGALYVHFDALYGVQNIHKYFMEAMMPALLGYKSVVLDRCWHSGPIYDLVFRNMEPEDGRQNTEICALLDRAASFCNAVYVKCLPPEDTCIDNWKSRLESELVKSEGKMRAIHKLYKKQDSSVCLPIVVSNYMVPPEKPHTTHLAELSAFIAKRREEVYMTNQPRVHIMVSSSVEKTDVDTMIDVPGVRFHPNSNEYKLAFDFSALCSLDDRPTAEELVNYISADSSNAELVRYFKAIGGSNKQYVFAIGDKATATMEHFMDNIDALDDGSLPPVHTTCLLDVMADSVFRIDHGMLPLNAEVFEAYEATARPEELNKQEDARGSAGPSGPDIKFHEVAPGIHGVTIQFNDMTDLKNLDVEDIVSRLMEGKNDVK